MVLKYELTADRVGRAVGEVVPVMVVPVTVVSVIECAELSVPTLGASVELSGQYVIVSVVGVVTVYVVPL